MYRTWCRQGAILFMETFEMSGRERQGREAFCRDHCSAQRDILSCFKPRAFYINLMQAAIAAKEEILTAVFSWTSRLFRAVGAWQFILGISWQLQLIEELAGIAAPGLLQGKVLANPIDSSSPFRSGFFGVSDFGAGGEGLVLFVLFLKKSEVQRVLG